MAAFAAAALRRAAGHEGALHVALARPGAPAETCADPDRAPLGAPPAPAEAAPDLVLRDLTGSRLTAAALGPGAAPTLTLARRGESLHLTLDFEAGALDPDAAIALLDAVAARIDEPLRHLF